MSRFDRGGKNRGGKNISYKLSIYKRLCWVDSKFLFKRFFFLTDQLSLFFFFLKASINRRERTFVQWHNGGHSAVEDSVTFNKLWCGSTEGRAGLIQKWHSDPTDPPSPQTKPLFTAYQLSSSLLTCGQESSAALLWILMGLSWAFWGCTWQKS